MVWLCKCLANSLPNVKRGPLVTVTLIIVVTAFYISGIHRSQWSQIPHSSSHGSLLSPNNPQFFYYHVSPWPECSDLRSEWWRLLSNQFVHSSPLHLVGNMFGLLVYGTILELYFIWGHLGVLMIFELGVIIGALGQTYVCPYTGLVGCSAGVYSLIGCNIAQFVIDHRDMDNLILLMSIIAVALQLFCDILLYQLEYNPNTAYFAHFAGFLFGLFAGILVYCTKSRLSFPGRITLGVIGGSVLALLWTGLLWQYIASWPPNSNDDTILQCRQMLTCCDTFYELLQEGHSANDIRSQYYCDGESLHAII